MCALVQTTPKPGNTITPSCGFPQKSFPPEGPHDFRGHLRRSRKSDIAAEESSSADYATCRHAPRPRGEQWARGCVLYEPRSALTFSPPVAARAPKGRPSYLRTHLISFLRELRVAQPNFHRRRSRRLKVAARSLSVARRPSFSFVAMSSHNDISRTLPSGFVG